MNEVDVKTKASVVHHLCHTPVVVLGCCCQQGLSTPSCYVVMKDVFDMP